MKTDYLDTFGGREVLCYLALFYIPVNQSINFSPKDTVQPGRHSHDGHDAGNYLFIFWRFMPNHVHLEKLKQDLMFLQTHGQGG